MSYSVRMDRITPSAIRGVAKRIASKPGCISFAGGMPDPALFPMESLKAVTNEVIDNEGRFAFGYGSTQGTSALLDVLAKRMVEKEGIAGITPANIGVTTGSQQGIAVAAMLFLDEGDVVVVENPTYLGGVNACRPYGCDFVGVDTDDEGMIIAELEKVLNENPKVKMIYTIPNFQNPTGKAWSLERRKQFMEVVNKYDVVVLEDNPYGEIRFKGEHILPLKAFDTKGQVIYLGSCSKILCPGLRVAWICANPEYVGMYEKVKESSDLQCCEFAQRQVAGFLERYDIEAHIDTIKAAYGTKCEAMLKAMDEHFPEEVKYTRPEGGMFIWVELPEGVDANVVLDDAIEAGVAYVPGEFFYANNGAKNTIRLNFTGETIENITKGVEILGEVFKKYV